MRWTLAGARARTTERAGSTAERRNSRLRPDHAACSRGASQKTSRASGNVAPNARLDWSPFTMPTRAGSTRSADALCSMAPSCSTTSPGRRRCASVAASGCTERARTNWAIPSAATVGRNAIVVASATPTPSAAARRHSATAIATVPIPKMTAPRARRGRRLRRAAERAQQRPRERERARQEREQRDEEERARAERHVLVREDALPGKAQHVVVDERVPEEAAVPRLDEHVPGQRDRGEEEDAPPRNPRREGPLARQPEEQGDDDHRRQRAHDVLRDRRETERRVEEHQAPAAAAAVRDREARPRQREPEEEDKVRLDDATAEEHAAVRGPHEARADAPAPAAA